MVFFFEVLKMVIGDDRDNLNKERCLETLRECLPNNFWESKIALDREFSTLDYYPALTDWVIGSWVPDVQMQIQVVSFFYQKAWISQEEYQKFCYDFYLKIISYGYDS